MIPYFKVRDALYLSNLNQQNNAAPSHLCSVTESAHDHADAAAVGQADCFIQHLPSTPASESQQLYSWCQSREQSSPAQTPCQCSGYLLAFFFKKTQKNREGITGTAQL